MFADWVRRPSQGALARVGALLVLALFATGCATDDATDTDGESPSTATEASGNEPVTVTAVDYEYQGLPSSLEAGSQLVLVNDSPEEVHELVAFRLADTETRSSGELVALPPDELEAAVGGPPATVLVTPPGADQIAAVGDGTIAETGRYLVFCAIPIGADVDEYLTASEASGDQAPDVEGGPPHFTQGMHGEFRVD